MTTTVTAISITDSKTTRTVTIDCPYCGKKHHHGWPYGRDGIGSRVAHCREATGRSYSIEPPKDYP